MLQGSDGWKCIAPRSKKLFEVIFAQLGLTLVCVIVVLVLHGDTYRHTYAVWFCCLKRASVKCFCMLACGKHRKEKKKIRVQLQKIRRTMQAYFDYDKLANYVVTLHFSYRMKLYFISALQVKRVVRHVVVVASTVAFAAHKTWKIFTCHGI